ncbi:nuclear pore protein 84/107 [Xylariales sp. PMI_506]|nr:nuclear pore protein 84/107 [Xylariales sp. PMI_506]
MPVTRSNRVSVTASGSFEMDEPMYDDDNDDIPTDFALDAERFAKALDGISNLDGTTAEKRAEILRLVDVYYNLATEKLVAAKESNPRSSRALQRRSVDEFSQDSMEVDDIENGRDGIVSDQDLLYLEREVQTWDLLRRLLPLRYPERKIVQPKRREPSKFQTSAELWDEFLQSDTTAQERKAILEVLQQTADESGEDIDVLVRELQQNAERGDIIAYGWLHTRSAIKMQKNVHGWTGPLDPNSSEVTHAHVDSTGANPLVTQLDPDVVTRQNRKLQPQDEYFERAIWLGCYELLRRGRSLADIRDWCVERTEVWRAMSMSAMPLSRDSKASQPAANPTAILLWRRTCFALARQGGTDDYERAVYGILSGDITSVEKVCNTWDDLVFANYNALLRTQFDSYVMKRSSPEATQAVTQSFPAFNAVQFHGDAATVAERFVSSLEANPKTAKEARIPVKSLQAAIISNTLDQYIYSNGLAHGRLANQEGTSSLILDFGKSKSNVDVEKYFPLSDQRGLRLLVHVYLLLSSLEELQGGESDLELRKAQENVLAAYVSTLRLNSLVELLPLYCSKFSGERAFYTLSRNVSKVADMEERRTLLRIMEKLGMDIADFVVFQPNSLLREHPESPEDLSSSKSLNLFVNEPPALKYGRRLVPDFIGEVDELEPFDEQLIQSLEWMMLVDGLWDEIFSVGVAIYKRFLKSYNLQAARSLSERVTCADIFRHKAGVAIQDDTDLSWFSEMSEGEQLLDEDGSTPRQLTTARNYLELESIVRALDSIETVGAYCAVHIDPTTQLPRDFQQVLGGHVKLVKNYVAPLLRGWLTESIKEDSDFEILRDMYLPDTILAYVSVLHYAGHALSRDNLLEAMELAALIAEKDADVAAVIMKNGRMKELVEAFANCSKALAVKGMEKKMGSSGSGSSKKMRELGWSRELWNVKR